jgi:predicted DNA-binding transcriptional regulator YafY
MLNKNAKKRYQVINQCLTRKATKYCSTEYLLEKLAEHDLNINARTLRYDLEAMRYDKSLSYFAPIVYCKINKGYYYSDPNYSIEQLKLTEKQIRALEFAANSLYEYRDLEVMGDFYGVIDKMAGIFRQMINPHDTSYIEYEKAPYYKGSELRDPILKAIQNKEALTVTYTTHERSFAIKHVLHPYLLKEYHNSLYLIGLLHSKRKPMTLALDRINSLATASVNYIENTSFDPKTYFENIIGVTFTDGPVEEIVLKVTPFLAKYIKAKHLHASQKIVAEDNHSATVTLQLIINYELIQLILSHGSNMTVISPASLKEKIKENLAGSLKQYDTP